RDREQPALSAGADLRGDVEEEAPVPALNQPDSARPLDHQHAVHAGSGGNIGGAVEATDPFQFQPRSGIAGGGGRQGEGGKCQQGEEAEAEPARSVVRYGVPPELFSSLVCCLLPASPMTLLGEIGTT